MDWDRHAVTLQRAGQSVPVASAVPTTAIRTQGIQTAGAPKNPFSGLWRLHRQALKRSSPCRRQTIANTGTSCQRAARHREAGRTCG
ncbi:hypothetical protein QM104_23990 [Leclercia adecarboxylata]|uniref:hypothetical protein n=1 Tax=Leclercia adecarboxylata TaxID=83655 RepID=UPI00294A0A92|nr:hypothetical protein [Leclercia adecarboxylata]MDV5280072.1 hypothetical protein [Leclercia adecarboxylata]